MVTVLPSLKSSLMLLEFVSTGYKVAGYGLIPNLWSAISFSLLTCSCSESCAIRQIDFCKDNQSQVIGNQISYLCQKQGNLNFWRVLLSILFPPLSVLDQGCGSIIIVFLLTLCGWVPGVIAALVILNNPERWDP